MQRTRDESGRQVNKVFIYSLSLSNNEWKTSSTLMSLNTQKKRSRAGINEVPHNWASAQTARRRRQRRSSVIQPDKAKKNQSQSWRLRLLPVLPDVAAWWSWSPVLWPSWRCISVQNTLHPFHTTDDPDLLKVAPCQTNCCLSKSVQSSCLHASTSASFFM